MQPDQTAGVARVHIEGQGGRIWPRAPCPSPSGLLTVICPGLRASISVLKFNDRGDKFTLGDTRGNIYLFHALQNRFSLVCRAGACPSAIAPSPSPLSIVAIAFDDGTIRILDTEGSSTSATLRGHRAKVVFLSFHPTGQFLASTSKDRVIIWDAREWRRIRTLETTSSPLFQTTYGPSGATIFTSVTDEGIIAWDSVKFKMLYQLGKTKLGRNSNLEVDATCFAINSANKYLIAGGNSPYIYLWSIDIQCLLRIAVMPSTVRHSIQVRFLPDGECAMVLGDDGVLLVFNVLSLKVLLTIKESHKAIQGFEISSGGNYCACLMSDGSVFLFDMNRAFEEEARLFKLKIKGGESEADAIARLGSLPVFDQNTMEEFTSPTTKDSKIISSADQNRFSIEQSDNDEDGYDKSRKDSSKSTDRSMNDSESSALTSRIQSKNKLMDPAKLKSLLRAYGEYPAEYRNVIWRFLLRLPENHDQFASFEQKGTHIALKNIHEKFPLQDRRLFRRLTQVLSAIYHWSPIFSEVEFLPALVFPFLRLFPSDNTVCFEIVISILLNWGRHWFEYFPNPPISMLKEIEDILRYHDSPLLAHFMSLGVEASDYAWPLIHTLFTEVFTKTDWLVFFDHLVSNRPSFAHFMVVAYLRHFRASLMTMQSHKSIETFLRHSNSNGAKVGKLIQEAYVLRKNTPKHLRPEEEPWTPINSGYYPEFSNYPKFVVDYQLKERQRIQQDVDEIESKKLTLEELQKKTEELERERTSWLHQLESLRNAEIERRARWVQEEDSRMRERQRLDRQALSRRKEQIDAMAVTVQARRRAEQDQRMAEEKRAQDEESQRRSRVEYELDQRLEEEALLNLEFQMKQTMIQTETEQQRQEESQKRRQILEQNKKARELKMAKLTEQWKIEDEERRIRQQVIQETKDRISKFNVAMQEQQIIENLTLLDELDQEMAIARVERERRLRHLAQEELERAVDIEEEQQKRTELLNQEEKRGKLELLEQERRWRERVALEREQILKAEKSRAALEVEKRAQRLQQMEREQRQRIFQEELRKRHLQEKNKLIEEEKEMETVLLSVDDEARRSRQLELEMKWKDEQMQEQMAFQKILKEAESQIIEDERKRYAGLQDQMRLKFQHEEEEIEKEHRAALSELVSNREKTFAAKNVQWRNSVRSENNRAAEAEYKANMEKHRQSKQSFQTVKLEAELRANEPSLPSSLDSKSVGSLRAEFQDLIGKQNDAIGHKQQAGEEVLVRPEISEQTLDEQAENVLQQHQQFRISSLQVPVSHLLLQDQNQKIAMSSTSSFAIDEVFGIIDSSATGRIDADNLVPILTRAGLSTNRKAAHEMLGNSFGVSSLTPVAFKRILEHPTTIEAEQDTEAAELLWAFQQTCIPNSEYMRVSTLRHFLKLFKIEIPDAQFDRIFAGLHIEANGTIEYRELINHILSNRSYLRR